MEQQGTRAKIDVKKFIKPAVIVIVVIAILAGIGLTV